MHLWYYLPFLSEFTPTDTDHPCFVLALTHFSVNGSNPNVNDWFPVLVVVALAVT